MPRLVSLLASLALVPLYAVAELVLRASAAVEAWERRWNPGAAAELAAAEARCRRALARRGVLPP